MPANDDVDELRACVRQFGLDLIRGDGQYRNRYALIREHEMKG